MVMRRAFALVVVFDQFCGGARALRGGGRVLSKNIKMPDPVRPSNSRFRFGAGDAVFYRSLSS